MGEALAGAQTTASAAISTREIPADCDIIDDAFAQCATVRAGQVGTNDSSGATSTGQEHSADGAAMLNALQRVLIAMYAPRQVLKTHKALRQALPLL